MEKISDTVTSVFHIAIKDNRPVVCTSGNSAPVWSEPFGLGWRFGVANNPQAWFSKIRLLLDHAQTQTEQEQAVVTVRLKDNADDDAQGVKERKVSITDFGHSGPTSLGSWTPADLASFPYVSLTVSTKARLAQPVANPLPSTSLALRRSLDTGDFVDAKFYVFSAKGSGSTAHKPRIVYANSKSIGVALPSTSRGKQVNRNGTTPAFLVNMTGDSHINDDSVLHEYQYEQDSDLDDEEEGDADDEFPILQRQPPPGRFQAEPSSKPHIPVGSTHDRSRGNSKDELPSEPPAYSVSDCRMILVKGVAYRTWLAYIYFRYTGQVSFRSLKSARGSSGKPTNDPNQPLSCSPKSMYRLAYSVGDERLQGIALRAIKEGLSKDNIIEEAFSWFTAQYATIFEYEVEKVSELRKLPEVISALKLQLKVVTLGEKPWAEHVLVAIMDKLNSSEPST